MSDPLYYLTVKSKVTGPFAAEQIRGMWKNGTITADAQICEVGSEEWRPVQQVAQASRAATSFIAAGNLTVLGRIGTPLFFLMGLPPFMFGLAGMFVGLPFLTLSGLCYCRARSVDVPAPTWHTWIISLCAVGAVIMALLAWLEYSGNWTLP